MKAAPGERFDVDFNAVPLESLTRLVSCAAERAFLFDPPSLGGRTVTVLGPRPVDLRGLEALFAATLRREGLVLEHRGAYERIAVP